MAMDGERIYGLGAAQDRAAGQQGGRGPEAEPAQHGDLGSDFYRFLPIFYRFFTDFSDFLLPSSTFF